MLILLFTVFDLITLKYLVALLWEKLLKYYFVVSGKEVK